MIFRFHVCVSRSQTRLDRLLWDRSRGCAAASETVRAARLNTSTLWPFVEVHHTLLEITLCTVQTSPESWVQAKDMDSRVTDKRWNPISSEGRKDRTWHRLLTERGGRGSPATAASFSSWHTHCPALCGILDSLLPVALTSSSHLVSGDAECHVPVKRIQQLCPSCNRT